MKLLTPRGGGGAGGGNIFIFKGQSGLCGLLIYEIHAGVADTFPDRLKYLNIEKGQNKTEVRMLKGVEKKPDF